MNNRYRIAGYCRISVDEEMDRDNVSIENQKAIVADYVQKNFPGSSLQFFEDRDRSGYTFEQREGYQRMRRGLMAQQLDILVIKDFSRFARRNSRGLVELEDLRDAGVRIISIGDGIDFPNDDDWLKIQFQFLINEMPVTDTSKKVKSVVKRRQQDGKWICAAPYGYIVNKKKEFEVVPAEAEVVRTVYRLYLEGWGYKKIANYLTSENIPTPRMSEKERKEEAGEEYKRTVKPVWSITTIDGMLEDDFYIGTLRQGKYMRRKINGSDVKQDEQDHLVFEKSHQAIIDYRTFALVRAAKEKRSTSHYRGVKKYDNVYSGFLTCGDCGSPMFAMSRADLAEAYRCGTYHRLGTKGCSSHHIRVDRLDELLKLYVRKVKESSESMLEQLNREIAKEDEDVEETEVSAEHLQSVLDGYHEELKGLKRQKNRDVMKHPEREEMLEEVYAEMEEDLMQRIEGLQHQIEMTLNKRNTIIRINRAAKTALEVFDGILEKEKLDRHDLELIIEGISVYEDHIEVRLKSDIDSLLKSGTMEETVNFKQGTEERPLMLVQSAAKHPDKIFCVNDISNGDPLEIFTDRDGEVILKKYSPVGELSSFAKEYTESLVRTLGHSAVICDKDQVISAAGSAKKELQDKAISAEMEAVLKERKTVSRNAHEGRMTPILAQEESPSPYSAQVITPILVEGEAVGAVMLLSREPNAQMGQTEVKVTETAAGFIGRQMEQ